MKTVNVSDDEYQLLLQAILFSASADIMRDWTENEEKVMVQLAKNLKNEYPEVIVNELTWVYFSENPSDDGEIFEPIDNNTQELVKIFPELNRKK